MDTSRLKKFAPQARKTLIEIVTVRLNYLLDNEESLEMEEHREAIKTLKADIAKEGKDQLIDRVAYTWFNRFMALRYMDVNDYQPLNLRVISPVDNATVPQILAEALQGNIADELKVDKRAINEILNGQTESNNPREEVFKMLLIASCNHLHSLFPFLFEKINDYTELLLPNDLLSDLSILTDFRNGMTAVDCKEVEVIGWLYQFYIAEKKDEVFAKKGKVNADEIPAATQLFTPRWIVEYMVQNTVGKLWLQNHPDSALKDKMPYYIETESSIADDYLKINSPEEITLLDQATGSGHILVYGFELLYQIYEEAGYNASEIPQLIIEKNLYGYEIDERAAQLASFALLMKAREYYRRIFRNTIQPNVLCYRDLRLTDTEIKETFDRLTLKYSDDLLYDLQCMQQATNLGSLIQPRSTKSELEKIAEKIEKEKINADLFSKRHLNELSTAIQQLLQLTKKFHCIVDNPPYMGGGNMNKELSDYVRRNYPDSKADLMACFMEAGLSSLHKNGLLGMINQHSWMFLSSYENLRKKLIENTQFDTLLHLGPRTFPEIGGEVVQNASFTFINTTPERTSSYIRLVDYKDTYLKSEKTLEAIQNPKCGWFYVKNQKDFKKIPGNNIGYWLSEKMLETFAKKDILDKLSKIRQGLATGRNDFFLRVWTEVNHDFLGFNANDYRQAIESRYKWFPYNKGGAFKKWYGNIDYVILFNKKGYELLSKSGNNLPSKELYFKKAITWSAISTGSFSVRIQPNGFLFSNAGMVCIPNNKFKYLIGFLNSKVINQMLSVLSPTINFNAGDIKKLPVIMIVDENVFLRLIDECIEISRQEWNSRETSWDFKQNELIRLHGQTIEEAVDLYKIYWTKKFIELHQNEEELNRQFIEIYGLEEDLDPNVPLEDITILRDELDQEKLKEISVSWQSGWELKEGKWLLENQKNYPDLPFDEKELIKQFISYAVGCMFGRYSLDKEGLILANQGETVEDYWRIVTSGDTADTGKSTELSEQRETKFTDGGANRSEQNDNNLNEKTKNSELTTHNSSLSSHSPFTPDEDNIIPVLDAEWFEDDIVTRFRKFVAAVWGNDVLEENMRFIEDTLGMNLRRYFLRDFYADHIKRYKKRPIYWQFSSPSGAFNVLIYMHRYDRDTLNRILANYLRVFIDKLENNIGNLENLAVNGSQREQTQAKKDIDATHKTITELKTYAHDVFLPLATERINIDLDDGVLVNYNKFGKVIKQVSGLNDAKTKKKVKGFDWIDTSEIR